jgi:hypothetical protein
MMTEEEAALKGPVMRMSYYKCSLGRGIMARRGGSRGSKQELNAGHLKLRSDGEKGRTSGTVELRNLGCKNHNMRNGFLSSGPV